MGALNKKVAPAKSPMAYSANGNLQLAKDTKQKLFELLMSTFYGKDDYGVFQRNAMADVTACIKELVSKNELVFVANAILFAANSIGMRTFPLVALVIFAQELRMQNKSFAELKLVVAQVIGRADSMTELYAYALSVFGSKNKIPLAIKKGIAIASNKFDAYQYGKYNRDNAVTFKDMLRIVHPVPKNDEQSRVFKAIMEGNLETPYTWETELSKNGQLPTSEQKSKAVLWGELIDSGKVGYMALLRNLRNIQDAGITKEAFAKLKNNLTNPIAIARSKQFPFAFANAAEQLTDFSYKTIVHEALNESVKNIPVIGGNVLIVVDLSGSMGSFTPKSALYNACLYAAMLQLAYRDKANVKVVAFSNDAKEVTNLGFDVISASQTISAATHHGGTDFESAIKLANKIMPNPDLVYILSDGDINPVETSIYRGLKLSGRLWTNATRVCFNFSVAESTPFGVNDGWIYLGGYSDKVFQYIDLHSKKNSLLEALNSSLQLNS